MTAPGYAVLDLETTGLFPAGHDRIVEIGVVLMGADGRTQDEWSTLVNPERDLGPSHVHGVYGRHAKHAPRFADVSDELVEVLDGRMLVAHNASFDTRFLAAEWSRLGVLPESTLPFGHVCTMRLAKMFLPGSGRTLLDCCAAFDIEIEGAHTALGDARATAALLSAYRATDPHAEVWLDAKATPVDASSIGRHGTRAALVSRDVALARADTAASTSSLDALATATSAPYALAPRSRAPVSPALESPAPVSPAPGWPAPGWPAPVSSAPGWPAPGWPAPVSSAPVSSSPGSPAAASLLEQVVVTLPAGEATSDADDIYLALLDRSLQDHPLTVTEDDALASLAAESGISNARLGELHERYFESVVTTAWADRVLTNDDVAQLDQLAEVLEISDEQRAEARAPRSRGRRARRSVETAGATDPPIGDTSPLPDSSHAAHAVSPTASAVQLSVGDQVVLTGSMRRSRDEWMLAIHESGYVVHPAVTKKTRVLVAADTDSLSGKARKARQYGVPIVAEDWLETRFVLVG